MYKCTRIYVHVYINEKGTFIESEGMIHVQRAVTESIPDSISLASPASIGSAMNVSLFFLFGVSEKHFIEEDSTTVSQKETDGSDTYTYTPVRESEGYTYM